MEPLQGPCERGKTITGGCAYCGGEGHGGRLGTMPVLVYPCAFCGRRLESPDVLLPRLRGRP